VHAVLIETVANQAYIFGTNKLRENVGASELTAQAGTRYVLDAVAQAGGQVPQDLRNPATFPTISDTNPVEIVLAVSGKALLLVRDADLGRQIVRAVTLRALREAPGLEVRGVVGPSFDFDNAPLHPHIGEVHHDFEVVRSRLQGPSARFQRLPIVAECATSGLPAARVASPRDQLPSDAQQPYSAQSFAKLAARAAWEQRRDELLARHTVSATLADVTTVLENLGCDWLAIVHADGNRLGQVFLNFHQKARTTNNREYIAKLRSFSLALDECTERAFCQALNVLRARHGSMPIVPLILGGDDLTVVCDGRQALQFTRKFIDGFEHATRQHSAINSILADGVTSCAGVAIVKPHFPFFAGYQLAEQLLRSAKKLAKQDSKAPLSAIDYHILYDASGPDLDRIRAELTVNSARLVARPYAVQSGSAPPYRSWADLERRIIAVRARDAEGRRQLPSSMLHELREGLFLGPHAAEARLSLVRNRYRPQIDPLLVDDKLFWQDTDGLRTALLDALDTAEFWEAQP
jgi:hypothetical protein